MKLKQTISEIFSSLFKLTKDLKNINDNSPEHLLEIPVSTDEDVEDVISNESTQEIETLAIEEVDTITSQQATVEHTESLLDNIPYMQLAEQCCQMHQELERQRNQVTDPTYLDFIALQQSRIREALLLSGANYIDGEKEFNLIRHTPSSTGIITNGIPIEETIEPGIEIDGRVMIKAKVKIITKES